MVFRPGRRPNRRTGCSFFALLLLALWTIACDEASDTTAPTPTTPPTNDDETEEVVVYPGYSWERVDEPEAVGYSSAALDALRAQVQDLNTTSMVVVVGGRVLFEYGDLSELGYVASVRKSILSMLYGRYVAYRLIRLDATLEELGIDDLGGLLPRERRARVAHLLAARSGVYHPPGYGGDDTDAAPHRGSQEPGWYYLYNNWDFNAAGTIFEQLTGLNIYDALEIDLAIPLGMRDYDRSIHFKSGNASVSMHRAYPMHISTRDMARLGYLMLREGRWDGRQIIPRDWVRESTRLITRNEEMNPPSRQSGADPYGYGYMWWVADPDRLPKDSPLEGAYRASGMYGQHIVVLPKLDMVIVHKVKVPPNVSVSRSEFRSLVDAVIAARCEPACP